MAYVFNNLPAATITAKRLNDGYVDPSKQYTIQGTNRNENSCDNAATQINKIFAIINTEVAAQYMKRESKEEATEE